MSSTRRLGSSARTSQCLLLEPDNNCSAGISRQCLLLQRDDKYILLAQERNKNIYQKHGGNSSRDTMSEDYDKAESPSARNKYWWRQCAATWSKCVTMYERFLRPTNYNLRHRLP